MDPSSFSSNAPGRLVRAGNYWAFVPNPLPAKLDLDSRTVMILSEADRALGQLAGIGRLLPNPHLLIRPFLRREAVLSSRIEGAVTELEQLLLFEATPASQPNPADVQEVANYVAAMEHGLKLLEELPVSLRLIRGIHERLLQGVRGGQHRPGEFRQIQNYLGSRGHADKA
jgi:Fic family protein